MHQPFYYDRSQDIFTLPWVRNHATKDYLYMAKLAQHYPKMKMTFNFTPSLLVQLDLYLQGKNDRVWYYAQKSAHTLTSEEKEFIKNNFFVAPSAVQTCCFPHFEELRTKASLSTASFTTQDWRDIQVLYQLLWFDPISIANFPELKQLIDRGKDYHEEDKPIIQTVTQNIISHIVPEYKNLSEIGMIELSATPFYHPIVPLLIDNWVAKESKPDTILPVHRFQYPQDADAHIQEAKDYSQVRWGREIHGMWPSEGSVSDATAESFARNGLSWIASGEEVLFHSLSLPLQRDQAGLLHHQEKLYCPWLFTKNEREIVIFFRDRFLSDLISFVYRNYLASDAVEDFIDRLENIRHTLPDESNPVVTVALDGENAWEYYCHNGYEFLTGLYDALSERTDIIPITPTQYILNHSHFPSLNHLVPGSWIYGFLNTWIGHPEKNWAWDQLFLVRQLVEKKQNQLDEERKKEVFDILYQAEGSDWFWWLGDDNPSVQKRDFRNQFITLLRTICALIGEEYLGGPKCV